jgi:hypothetical protein
VGVRPYRPFYVRYNTGEARGGTLTISIDNGRVLVPGCRTRPAASVTCQIRDRIDSRMVMALTRSPATVTITLRNTAGLTTTMTVQVRVP